ncbi:hypothetical protein DFH09DRAFT_432418 [Mycena vulgaris]|nr:hypothetical protein DFH09DRAFT_432418 [Mycena vulgaris]
MRSSGNPVTATIPNRHDEWQAPGPQAVPIWFYIYRKKNLTYLTLNARLILPPTPSNSLDMADPDPAAPQARQAPRKQRDFEDRYKDKDAPGVSFRAGLPHYRNAETVEAYNASGSKLGVDSLLAFRVLPILDLPTEDVIPDYPDKKPTRPGLRETMLNYLCAATADDLGLVTVADLPSDDSRLLYRQELIMEEKEEALGSGLELARATTIDASSMTNFLGNPFLLVFTALRDLRSRLLAEECEDLYDGRSVEKSAEANEDKAERGSEELLHRLVEVILLYFAQETDEDWFRSTAAASSHQVDLLWDRTENLPVPQRKNKTSKPIPKETPAPAPNTAMIVEEAEENTEISDALEEERPVDGTNPPTILRFTAADDGYLYLSRAGKTSGSNRWSDIPIVRYEAKRLDLSGFKTPKEQLADFAEKNAKKKGKKKKGADKDEGDKKTTGKIEEEDAMRPGDLKIIAQQFAEMLTGIYANVKYANDATRKENARQLAKLQFTTDLTRLERIKQTLADKKSDQKEMKLLKMETRRTAVEKSKRAKEDSVAQKTLAAETALGNRGGVGSRLSAAQKVLVANGGAEKVLAQKVTKPPPSVVTNIQKQRLTPKAANGRGTKQEQLEVKQRLSMKKRAGNQKLEEKKSKLAEAIEMTPIMKYLDQEAFNIRIRHTYLSISRVVTPEAYLKAVRTKSRLDHDVGFIEFKRTKEFNLLDADGRRSAGEAIWALLVHLHSGKTKIGRLQGASKEGQALYGGSVEQPRALPTQRYPPRGIKNLGLSCYANSVIQGISAAISLRHLQMLAKPAEPAGNLETLVKQPDPLAKPVLAMFLHTVATLIGGPLDAEAMDISPLLNLIPGFTGNRQEDPSEFLIYLVDRIREVSGMKDLFAFNQSFTQMCTECRTITTQAANATELIPHVQPQKTTYKIVDLLQEAFALKRIDDKFTCPAKCDSASADERMSLDTLPRVLVVQLQRTRHFFPGRPPTDSEPDNGVTEHVLKGILAARTNYQDAEKEWRAAWRKKNPCAATTGKEWEKEFTAFRNGQGGYIAAKNETPVDVFSEDKKSFQIVQLSAGSGAAKKESLYELYALICHIGTIEGGHYVAYVRHDKNAQSEWYLCDDSTRSAPLDLAKLATELEAKKHDYKFIPTGKGGKTETKYYWKEGKQGSIRMLFYRRVGNA